MLLSRLLCPDQLFSIWSTPRCGHNKDTKKKAYAYTQCTANEITSLISQPV